MWDAVIAGAGPAGAVAACVLARSGRRVLLADATPPGAFKVGEALPGAATRLLSSLDLPVLQSGPHAAIGGNLCSWGSSQLIADDFMRHPDGAAWRLDRSRFDADLLAEAIRSGADHCATGVKTVQRRDDNWIVQLENGTVTAARWIVDASGRRAAIARRLGAKRRRDASLIALYRVGTPAAGFELNRTVIEAAPHGWWYAARLPSGAPIAGFHTRSRHARTIVSGADWRAALDRTAHVARLLKGAMFDRPLVVLEACGAQLDRFGGEGWVACGDAAMSFDPISGQGIFSALYGGMEAARVADAGLRGRSAALGAYATRLASIRRLYLARCAGVYRNEGRWAGEPFWQSINRELQVSLDQCPLPPMDAPPHPLGGGEPASSTAR